MDDGWLIIYSGILRPYMHIHIYIYIIYIYISIIYIYLYIYIYIVHILPYVLDIIIIVPSVSQGKRRDLRFLLIFLDLRFTSSETNERWHDTVDGRNPAPVTIGNYETLGLQWDFGWWWYIWYTMFIPSKAFYPLVNIIKAIENSVAVDLPIKNCDFSIAFCMFTRG